MSVCLSCSAEINWLLEVEFQEEQKLPLFSLVTFETVVSLVLTVEVLLTVVLFEVVVLLTFVLFEVLFPPEEVTLLVLVTTVEEHK